MTPHPAVTVAAPLLVALSACGAMLGGPDLPVLADGSSAADAPAATSVDARASADAARGMSIDASLADVSTVRDASGARESGASSGSGSSARPSDARAESGSGALHDSGANGDAGVQPDVSTPGFDAGGATGDGGSAPSCATEGPGLTNCGVADESCCASPEVTGGAYDRSYTNQGSGPEDAGDPATVTTFRLDKYLVTVGRFRKFVHDAVASDAGAGWLPAPGSGKHAHLNGGNGLLALGVDAGSYEPGWLASDDFEVDPTSANLACDPLLSTWTRAVGNNENRPINCVTWQEAYAFCIWDGGFLPSESEWEYAAAGGAAEREYPWGTTDPGTNNEYAIYGCNYPSGSVACLGVTNIAPVGTPAHGAGMYGQLDLSGDAWEWTADWYKGSYESPCHDCAYLGSTFDRSVRGGNFGLGESYLPPPYRLGASPTVRSRYMGIRCARTP